MNEEDVFNLANKAGLGFVKHADPKDVAKFQRFAALVASAEREACAEIADKLPRTYRETKEAHERATLEPFHPSRFGFDFAEMRQAEVITHAILARGQA